MQHVGDREKLRCAEVVADAEQRLDRLVAEKEMVTHA
jgi:hypothetical protein